MAFYRRFEDAQDLLSDNGNRGNLVFQGDNKEVLERLLPFYECSFDLIVTDPPYNVSLAGNYRDSFSEEEWRSFISERFSLARRFLKDDGYMFVHIADETYPVLRDVLDEAFGRRSYIGTIVWDKRNSQNDAHDVQCNHEFICVYKKDPSARSTSLYEIAYKKAKVHADADGREWVRGASLTTGGMGGVLERRPNLGYSVYVSSDGAKMLPVSDYDMDEATRSDDESKVYFEDFSLPAPFDGCTTTKDLLASGYRRIRPPKKGSKLGCWTWSIDTFLKRIDEVFPSKTTLLKKIFVNAEDVFEENEKRYCLKVQRTPARSIVSFPSADGSKQLTAMTGEKRLFSRIRRTWSSKRI